MPSSPRERTSSGRSKRFLILRREDETSANAADIDDQLGVIALDEDVHVRLDRAPDVVTDVVDVCALSCSK